MLLWAKVSSERGGKCRKKKNKQKNRVGREIKEIKSAAWGRWSRKLAEREKKPRWAEEKPQGRGALLSSRKLHGCVGWEAKPNTVCLPI